VWDGLVSCLREWKAGDWLAAEAAVGAQVRVDEKTVPAFSSLIEWTAKKKNQPVLPEAKLAGK
jgi:hypothetical protein